MKLLAVADVHGQYSAVTDVIRRVTSIDALIVAGDLSTRGTPEEITAAIREWQTMVPRLYAVAGNMDSPAIDTALDQLGVSVNGRGERFQDIALVGCSAAPVSIGTPYEIPEAEIKRRVEQGHRQVEDAPLIVFVPHAPPYGLVDMTHSGINAGSRSVRDYIERVQPRLTLCGHIHEARGQATLGDTLIVNCGPAARGHYAVVNLDTTRCEAELF